MDLKGKNVLILGANSDVAKALMPMYLQAGAVVMAASRNTEMLEQYAKEHAGGPGQLHVLAFDAQKFDQHATFYASLPAKPHLVVYAAGFLVDNPTAFQDFSAAHQMMEVNYAGAVSILNLIAFDPENTQLRRIIGLSSLSGVRGRRSNFVYGSTKAAFATYLAGLRQELRPRGIQVNVVVAGYIRTKINEGLDLNESLIMEPAFVAGKVFRAGRRFRIVPGWKWKIIHLILRVLPESLVARLP